MDTGYYLIDQLVAANDKIRRLEAPTIIHMNVLKPIPPGVRVIANPNGRITDVRISDVLPDHLEKECTYFFIRDAGDEGCNA